MLYRAFFLCLYVGIALLALSPAHAQTVYTPFSQQADVRSTWSFYVSSQRNLDASRYTRLEPAMDKDSAIVAAQVKPHVGVPYIRADLRDTSAAFEVRAESDKSATNRQGDILLVWTCPRDGSYRVDLAVRNAGMNVFGGDGGMAFVSVLSDSENADATRLITLLIPTSLKGQAPEAGAQRTFLLKKSHRLLLRLNAKLDGYGDRFLVDYAITPTDVLGEAVVSRGWEGVLADPPAVRKSTGVPMRDGLFWMGVDGGWANSEFADESVRLLKKFIPDLAVVMIANRPENLTIPPVYSELNVPTIIQTWGRGCEPYLQANDAFEKDWRGTDLGTPDKGSLWGTAHAAAMPHPATQKVYTQVLTSAIRSGYTGFGYCDMVWMWGAGRGVAGHNPATIAAFRKDLAGSDAGLPIAQPDGSTKIVKFADYVKFYTGAALEPADLGVTRWDGYQPLTRAQYEQMKKAGKDTLPELLVFDLLCHYEWLKFADLLGRTAAREGGIFQCMPNPEDLANGVDLLWLNKLDSVRISSEEYFNSPSYLDGAYYRFNYLRGPVQKNRQAGVVMEIGGGGNNWPYYSHEISYITAYELTLAAAADHMEGDFWPSRRVALREGIQSNFDRNRYQNMFSYGLGFTHARADRAVRPEASVLSVTARRIFRPWGQNWHPWNWHLDRQGSPDPVLAQGGYLFDGVGEEYLEDIDQKVPVVLYSPTTPTECGWRTLNRRLSAGQFGAAIVPASSLQRVVTLKLNNKPFAELFKDFNFTPVTPAEKSGRVVTADGKHISNVDIKSQLYEISDSGKVILKWNDHPLVIQRDVNGRPLYVVLFDPDDVNHRPLTQAVYAYLLNLYHIESAWRAPESTYVRTYRKDGLTVAALQSAVARDFSVAKSKGPDGHIKYKTDSVLSADIRLQPGTTYNWVSLPSGSRGRAVSDAGGFLSLSAPNVSAELFFITAGDTARLDEIASRRAVLEQAWSLDGLIKKQN